MTIYPKIMILSNFLEKSGFCVSFMNVVFYGDFLSHNSLQSSIFFHLTKTSFLRFRQKLNISLNTFFSVARFNNYVTFGKCAL